MKCNLILLSAFVAGNITLAVPPPRPDVKPKPVPVVRPLPADRIFRAGPPIRPIPPPITVGRPAPIPPRGAPASATKGENVKLLNGDVFRGKFIGLDPAKGVIWQHPHIKPDLEIKPGSVARVTFADQKLPATAKHHSCNVMLANGDSLCGELVSLENDKLILKTWYAGNLPISRSAIKSLSPGFTAAKMVFEGPNAIENWSITSPNMGIAIPQLPPNAPPAQVDAMKRRMELMKGKWELKGGGFEARTSGAMVGRNFKNLPDRASIEFDVDWSSYLNLYVNLYTDNVKSYSSGNSYSLRINQTYAYLYRYTRNRGSQNVGGNVRINIPRVAGKNRMKIEFKVDKKKREFALYVNGKFMKKWKDAQADFAGKGSGLLFTTRSANLTRVSNIRIQEWNGTLPGQSKVAATNGKEDFVVFNNEDSITGKLIGIKTGKMKFKTTFAELPIPLENVDTIHLSKEGIKTPPIPAGSMRVTLKGKGTLTLRIKEWKNGKITAVSPIFGETTLNADALRSVEFNLGKPRTTAAVAPPSRSPYATNPMRNNNGAIPGIQILGGGFGGKFPPGVMEKLELQIEQGQIRPQIFEQLKLNLNENRRPIEPRRRR